MIYKRQKQQQEQSMIEKQAQNNQQINLILNSHHCLDNMRKQSDDNQKNQREIIERLIFDSINVLNYQVNYVKIDHTQTIYTIFIKSPHFNKQQHPETFYLGHGFGGTSLLYFHFIPSLLLKGNVVIWEVRGMGLNIKKTYENIQNVEQIERFFLLGIDKIINYYQHKKIIMMCHSFSGYLALMYMIKHGCPNIKKLVLLSPIGITPRQLDYKYRIKSCSDVIQTLFNKFGWFFKLTYKSPLRTICSCCKSWILQKSLSDVKASKQHQEIMKNIILFLIKIQDGSQQIFFNYFQPRVLPKLPVQPIFQPKDHIKVYLFYGGQNDWVDRQGAYQLAQKHSSIIQIGQIEKAGHQIPLDIAALQQILNHITML